MPADSSKYFVYKGLTTSGIRVWSSTGPVGATFMVARIVDCSKWSVRISRWIFQWFCLADLIVSLFRSESDDMTRDGTSEENRGRP